MVSELPVLIFSHYGLFPLLSGEGGLSVTVVWEMWPSLLSHLGLVMLLSLAWGVLNFCTHHRASHLVMYRVISLIFPFLFECMDFSCIAPNPRSCTFCLDGHLLQQVMSACPLIDTFPFLFAYKGTVLLIYLWSVCVLYCIWWAFPSLWPILSCDITPLGSAMTPCIHSSHPPCTITVYPVEKT